MLPSDGTQEHTSLQYSHGGKRRSPQGRDIEAMQLLVNRVARPVTPCYAFRNKAFSRRGYSLAEQLRDSRATELSLPEGATFTFSLYVHASAFCLGGSQHREVL